MKKLGVAFIRYIGSVACTWNMEIGPRNGQSCFLKARQTFGLDVACKLSKLLHPLISLIMQNVAHNFIIWSIFTVSAIAEEYFLEKFLPDRLCILNKTFVSNQSAPKTSVFRHIKRVIKRKILSIQERNGIRKFNFWKFKLQKIVVIRNLFSREKEKLEWAIFSLNESGNRNQNRRSCRLQAGQWGMTVGSLYRHSTSSWPWPCSQWRT